MAPLFVKFSGIIIAFLSLYTFAQTDAFQVKITGNGNQALVFIPGLASSGKVFKETRKEFEGDFTTYTFSLAGFAGVPAMENPDFETWKDAIATYLREKEIKNPIIIGHSMGGALAMAIAADYPELPKKIVVVDALPFLAGLNPNYDPKIEADCNTMIKKMMAMGDEEFRKAQEKNIRFMVADSTKQDLVLHWSLNSDRKTVAKVLCDYLKLDVRKKIKNITIPTLVLLEPYFKNVDPAIQAQFKNLKPLTLNYAPTGRHFLMYGAKAWFMEQLHRFIEEKQ